MTYFLTLFAEGVASTAAMGEPALYRLNVITGRVRAAFTKQAAPTATMTLAVPTAELTEV